MNQKRAYQSLIQVLKVNSTSFLGYLFIIFVLASFTTSLYFTDLNTEIQVIERLEEQNVFLSSEIISTELQSIISDIIFLSQTSELRQFVGNNTDANSDFVMNQFLSFLGVKEIYDQIRLLNMSGMEIVRVNYNNSYPYIVEEAFLQNKSSRYYYSDSLQLTEGEVYVSYLDLNIEQGTIEVPLKPMIRFTTPIYSENNNKEGILVLNYLASSLLTKLKNSSTSFYSNITLINSEGYWLVGLNQEDEWGFMYANRTNMNLKIQDPKSWSFINSTLNGQINTASGFISYRKVHPLLEGSAITDIPPSHEVNIITNPEDYYWIIMSIVNSGYLAQMKIRIMSNFFLIGVVACVVTTLGFSILLILRTRKKVTQKLLEEEKSRYYELMGAKNRELGEFANSMNHDLRGYLTKILMTSQLLLQERNISHIQAIDGYVMEVKDLLAHSAELADAGFITGEKKPVDLNNVLRKVMGVILTSDAEISYDILPMVLADEIKLFQVFKNLIENAIVHGKANKIRLAYYRLQSEAFIEIHNNGNPIADDLGQELINSGFNTKRVGEGLGLKIINKIVEAHGWNFSLQSASPVIFRISIPLKEIIE